MKNVAPPTQPLILREMGVLICVGLGTGLSLPPLFAAMMDLGDAQLRYLRTTMWIGIVLALVVTWIGLVVGLRDITGARSTDEIARRRVLRLPLRLAGASTIVGGATTILGMLVRMMLAPDPAALIFGVGLTSAALVSFYAVPLYIGTRWVLLPHALFFAQESLPPSRRLPLGLLAGYTVLSVAALALVPAAVFGNARLGVARERAASERARATAHRLAAAVANRSPLDAVRLVTHMQLEHANVLVRMPSGQVLPEELSVELAGAAFEEAPLSGELSGGAVRVVARPRASSQAALLLVVLGLIGVATLVASTLARTLSQDARGVTRQVEALAEGREPAALSTVFSSEIRRVTLAVNRLLERIPRLQLEMFLAVERADESRRLKSMFLANMSHDLRSPLNSILGFSELLMRGLEGPITAEQRVILQDIHATGSHLLRLLSEILDTARAESGHLDLDRKPVPPATFVTQARKEALRGRPEQVGDRLVIDLQAGTPPIRVDALRMQQALTHVLDWAIDAARDRAVRVEIGDRDRVTGRAFVIEVSCDRVTTADDDKLLFQAFRKVDGVPGLHLALPLAKRLVEAHGGAMESLGADANRHVLGVRIVLPRGDVSRDRGK